MLFVSIARISTTCGPASECAFKLVFDDRVLLTLRWITWNCALFACHFRSSIATATTKLMQEQMSTNWKTTPSWKKISSWMRVSSSTRFTSADICMMDHVNFCRHKSQQLFSCSIFHAFLTSKRTSSGARAMHGFGAEVFIEEVQWYDDILYRCIVFSMSYFSRMPPPL